MIGVTERGNADPGHEMLATAFRDDYWDVVMILFNMINQSARERVLVECGGSREDPPGWVTRESDARTLPEAAYRFVRHEPGIDVTLSGTGSSRASIRSPRSRGATPARARGRRRLTAGPARRIMKL